MHGRAKNREQKHKTKTLVELYRLGKLQKSRHLLFTTESEGEWVYS